MSNTTVGILARITPAIESAIRSELSRLPGVQPFDAGDETQMGILIEAPTLDLAHERITNEIKAIKGVHATWPVYMHLGDEEIGSASDDTEVCILPEDLYEEPDASEKPMAAFVPTP